jgi:hypothetical protein
VADLSNEAIEFARTWQSLPMEQRVVMKAAVVALANQPDNEKNHGRKGDSSTVIIK